MVTSFLVTAGIPIFSLLVARFIIHLDLNKRIYNHVPGECVSIQLVDQGTTGFDTSFHGVVFMTTGYCSTNCTQNYNGHLLVYNSDNRTATQLVIRGSKISLNPSALSIVPSRKKVHLMVVNRRLRTTVELYSYDEKKSALKHLRSVKSKKFKEIVDIAAVDRSRFFLTKHTYTSNTHLKVAESLLAIKTGSILFFDGNSTKTIASVATPTGIVYDQFQRQLFVASFSKESVQVYQVHEDFNVTLQKEIPLGCAPWSLWRDIDNSIVITCHPIKIRYLLYNFNSSDYISPSQVIRLYTNRKDGSNLIQLYANDGATISAASASIRSGNSLLVASDKDIIVCDIPVVQK